VTVSLVAPEDNAHHTAICSAQSMKILPVHKVDLSAMPILRSRVKLAKKVATLIVLSAEDNIH
jgi:hypothetical protein